MNSMVVMSLINAANICKKLDIVRFFRFNSKGQKVLVFYCESASDNRAFRNFDRKINIVDYPSLRFPQMYILEGGYKIFYSNFPELCVNGFIPMRDQQFRENGEIKRCHSLHRSNFVLSSFEDLDLEQLLQTISKDI